MTTQTPPPYTPQQQAPAPVQRATPGHSNGFPVTSMILGIVSLVGFGFLTGIPAIIFGAIALKHKQPERGMSLAGVITGSIGTFFSLLFIAFAVMMYTIGNNSDYYNSPQRDGYGDYYYESENPRT